MGGRRSVRFTVQNCQQHHEREEEETERVWDERESAIRIEEEEEAEELKKGNYFHAQVCEVNEFLTICLLPSGRIVNCEGEGEGGKRNKLWRTRSGIFLGLAKTVIWKSHRIRL